MNRLPTVSIKRKHNKLDCKRVVVYLLTRAYRYSRHKLPLRPCCRQPPRTLCYISLTESSANSNSLYTGMRIFRVFAFLVNFKTLKSFSFQKSATYEKLLLKKNIQYQWCWHLQVKCKKRFATYWVCLTLTVRHTASSPMIKVFQLGLTTVDYITRISWRRRNLRRLSCGLSNRILYKI